MNLLVEGVFAACLGLAAVAMLVLLLWITSPYPDSGPGGALRTAAGLWLLAHGADLVRTDTLGGPPAPLGVSPLLLTVLPVVLLQRVARSAEGAARSTVALLAAGYLTVAVPVAWFSAGGALRVDLLSAALRVPPFVLAVVAAGVWLARGRPSPPVERLPRLLQRLLPRPGRSPAGWTALCAAGVAVAVLTAGGALLAAGMLVWHGQAAQEAFPRLTEAWSGRTAVLLLCLALAPNAAVWGAAYGLGPGFSLGVGSTVTPLSAGGYPQLPHFPLLAALPPEGAAGPVTWVLAGVLPLAAGTAAGWYVARAQVPLPGSAHGATSVQTTAGTAALAAVCCGLAGTLLADLAGGPLGAERLSVFGPDRWLTGAAALGWMLVVATPAALLVRLWRLRDPHPVLAAGIGRRRALAWCRSLSARRPEPDAEWHGTGARHSRWAALKRASGGLVPDLDPARRRDAATGDGPEAAAGTEAAGGEAAGDAGGNAGRGIGEGAAATPFVGASGQQVFDAEVFDPVAGSGGRQGSAAQRGSSGEGAHGAGAAGDAPLPDPRR